MDVMNRARPNASRRDVLEAGKNKTGVLSERAPRRPHARV